MAFHALMVEVFIAGAGPAGATTALVLARAGLRVLLVDRARFPRDKLCGDTINPGALAVLDRLGLSSYVEEHGLRLDGMIVTGEGGARVRGRYRGCWGRALRRRDLDWWLVRSAIAAGARFEDGVQVLEAMVSQGERGPEVRGVVVRGRDGTPLQLPALATVAADGRRSTLAFGLGLARHPAWPRRWAAGAYVEGVAGLTSYGEMHVRRHSYLGVAPMPGGVANACLVTGDRRGFDDPGARLRAAIAADARLRERFAHARFVSPVVSLGPLAVDTTAAGLRGLVLAGDAAGFIDPITGDGIHFALRGAELAALAVLDGLQGSDGSAHERLAISRRAAFARKRLFNRVLRRIVGAPEGVRLAGLAGRVAPFVFRRIIAIAGDVDAAGRLPSVSKER